LDDPRLIWLARRLIFVERPDLLPVEHHELMAAQLAGRLVADPANCGGWTTVHRAASDLATILSGLDEMAAGPFHRLSAYLDARRTAN
jgi:hypothetical protein